MKSSHATIKDIARQLNISISTVSRALKNHPDISQHTKEIVNALAKELHYSPNPIALSLKNRKSQMVGVILPEVVHYFFATVLTGIEQVAEQHGYTVVFAQSNENLEREKIALQTLMKGRVDGILVSISKQTDSYSHFQKTLDESIPLVFFDRIAEGIVAPHVTIDNFGGAYEATKHLAEQGCKSIAHFYGPSNRKIFRDRMEGYKQALADSRLTFDPQLLVPADNFEKGLACTQQLLEQNIAFDAIFAVNDFTAAGCLRALRNAKIAVPQQVAVMGFANESIATMLNPNLSSVHQSGFETGQQAMHLLLKQIESEETLAPQHIVLPASLVVRESSLRKKK